jgi:O-antigen ligase
MIEIKNKYYLQLLAYHFLLGLFLFLVPSFSKIYRVLVILVGFYIVVKNRNRNSEVLIVSGYIIGIEVLIRMTGGIIFYELSKYSVLFFLILGIYYSGFSKNAIPYWIYILLLLPGVIIATETLNLQSDIGNIISFNISGPLCLGIASIYCFDRKISMSQLNNVLLAIALPTLAITVFLIFYTPDLKEVLTGTGSNYKTSGGFGPNQVSTMLGLGMFIFFSRLIFNSKIKLIFILNLVIVLAITFRGLITFSRGGMITGFAMIPILLFFIYLNTKKEGRYKLNFLFILISIALVLTWFYTSSQTGGLIEKRYANQDALGRTKQDRFSGREEIWDSEVAIFVENPIFGIGVGKATEYRYDNLNGMSALSHNEISRTLAEHGTLGIIALLIVFFTPIFLYLDNKQNIYLFCFILFWLLTINHAAMRIAAPAFVYSLSLLKVTFDKNEY